MPSVSLSMFINGYFIPPIIRLVSASHHLQLVKLLPLWNRLFCRYAPHADENLLGTMFTTFHGPCFYGSVHGDNINKLIRCCYMVSPYQHQIIQNHHPPKSFFCPQQKGVQQTTHTSHTCSESGSLRRKFNHAFEP